MYKQPIPESAQLSQYDCSWSVNDVYGEPAFNLKCSKEKYVGQNIPMSKITKFKYRKRPSWLQLRRIIEIYYFHPWVGQRLHHHSTDPVCCSQWQSVVSALVMSTWKHLTVRTTQTLPHPALGCLESTIWSLLSHIRADCMKRKSFPTVTWGQISITWAVVCIMHSQAANNRTKQIDVCCNLSPNLNPNKHPRSDLDWGETTIINALTEEIQQVGLI